MSSVTETSTLFPTGYKNRLQPPVSVVIKGNYVTEVCICERDGVRSGLDQRSFILSFPPAPLKGGFSKDLEDMEPMETEGAWVPGWT